MPVDAYVCATKTLTCSKRLTFFSIKLQWLRSSIQACLVYKNHKIYHISKFDKDWTSTCNNLTVMVITGHLLQKC